VKSYTKAYFKAFGYTVADFIPCEVCSAKAVDIHHIEARSIAAEKLNAMENLMALCRKCHVNYGDKKQHKDFLEQKHRETLEMAGLY
jgi:5-methylcytosine-specific restriction endonuclease McrA